MTLRDSETPIVFLETLEDGTYTVCNSVTRTLPQASHASTSTSLTNVQTAQDHGTRDRLVLGEGGCTYSSSFELLLGDNGENEDN